MKTFICLSIVIVLSACANLPERHFLVINEKMEIVVMNEVEILAVSKKMFGQERRGLFVGGNPVKIYVPYSPESDERGNRLPDFAVLGHEIWHLRELGGNFHDN